MEKPAGAHVTRHGRAWILPICNHCNFVRPDHRPGEAFRVQKFVFGRYAIEMRCRHTKHDFGDQMEAGLGSADTISYRSISYS